MVEAPESIAENVMAHVRRSMILEKNGDKTPERSKKHQTERKHNRNKPGFKVILSAAACLALVVAAAYTLPVFKGADAAQVFAAPKAAEPQTANIIYRILRKVEYITFQGMSHVSSVHFLKNARGDFEKNEFDYLRNTS